MPAPAEEPSVAGMNEHDTPVAIITGASRGLGQALAAGLAGAGWRLVIDARTPDALAEARWNLPAGTVAIAGDVTDPAHRAELIAAAADLGRLDLLVNNAGILGPSPQPSVADSPLAALREVYEVNVIAPLALAQLALPALAAAGGCLIMVTSDAAVEPYPGWGGYGSAKAAVDQLTRVLAAELADDLRPGETVDSGRGTPRVWAVDPGDLRTQMHQEAFPDED